MTTLVLLAAAAALPGGLSPVAEGKALCQAPDPAFKTCLSIARYTPSGEGRMAYLSRTVLDADGRGVIEEEGEMTLVDGRWCERPRASDEARWRVTIHGRPATPSERAAALKPFRRYVTPLNGKLLCFTVAPDRDGFLRADVTADGRPLPTSGLVVKWVDDKDGYKVGF